MHVYQSHSRERDLETSFLILVGAALIYLGWMQVPALNPIENTIVLIFFLGLLLGIARVPFPRTHKLWLFPWIAGILSGFMDSFLVLLMISVLPLKGKKEMYGNLRP